MSSLAQYFRSGLDKILSLGEHEFTLDEKLISEYINNYNGRILPDKLLYEIYEDNGVDEEYIKEHEDADIFKVIQYLNSLVDEGKLSRMDVYYIKTCKHLHMRSGYESKWCATV